MSRTDLKNLAPLVTESRLARQYAAIQSRIPAAPPRRRGWAGWAVAAAALTALAVVVVHTERARRAGPVAASRVDETVVESGPSIDGARAAVTLADGSRVELGASTRARLTSARAMAIRIELERGSVDVEATHVEGRTFVVGAGPYEVRVVGTHFAVQREPDAQIAVRVERGAVDVVASAGGETRRLAAGEQWSAPDVASLMGPAPEPLASGPIEAPMPAAAPSVAVASASAPDAGNAGNVTAIRHDEGPRELFDDAQRARADGRTYDAARAFDRLRRTFPHDPRAALSAFELGRLRLDTLGDPRGAEEALRDAVSLGPSSPFREDAEARRVEALWRSGDTGGCAVARTAYLARWPNGTYRRAVELGCGDR